MEMQLQSASVLLQNASCFSSLQFNRVTKQCRNNILSRKQKPRSQIQLKSTGKGEILCAAHSNSIRKLNFRVNAVKGSDPFRGKPGSVSFHGLTHQLVEEGKLVSAPFKEKTGSLLWVLAPIGLISSLVVPQFFIVNAVEDFLKNEVLSEIVSSFLVEVIFYSGVAIFLRVTDHVQKPYLEFSPKRWGLITGLRGYLTSAFFTMGLKVFAPLFVAYMAWPALGLPAVVSVAPYLLGCLVQYAFEKRLDGKESSCWPLVPIIFEVYRIYQLTRATSFIEKLIFAMRDASATPAALDRANALVSMMVTFRVLGVVCLWSLLTFLLRLFPSRPVAENY